MGLWVLLAEVEFKIRGKELVGVLANYNNKTAKVR